eukprot:TRINITY_DN41_c0_g1_i3.p1 TRINITY_DN41_c0_g1~~TRINITY_DN41_c0_g1_i3.p1  ORF type:complete len:353 (+),score=160.03 TRINITY_DN41_c0_g1_i3:42-1100(+)
MTNFSLKNLRDTSKASTKAATTTDKAWADAGKTEGLQIWRIENFTVKAWPREKYGKFFSGDSYIVLKTIGADKKSYDVHFWLGAHTTQDEAGTAAYKTVELDDHLGGIPVQYREVEGHESESFLKCFPKGITILQGGINSGFNIVKPQEYKPRLFHVSGTLKLASSVEVDLAPESLCSEDVFVLDNGLQLFQWNGKSSNAGEKSKGGAILRQLREERNFKPSEPTIIEEGEDNDQFWAILGGKGAVTATAVYSRSIQREKAIYRLSDSTGDLTFAEVAKGAISKSQLSSEDVFIIDNTVQVIAWVGSKSSRKERKNALSFAETYLEKYNLPRDTPVIRQVEGHENGEFKTAF